MKSRTLVITSVATLALAALVAASFPPKTAASTAPSVERSESKQIQVSGKPLQLNGSGIRTVKIAMVPIRAYEASFYTPEPLRSPEDVIASSGPLRFDFKFLKGVSEKQVTKAWNAQFDASNTKVYDSFEADKERFVSFFGGLDKGATQSVVIDGDETRAYEDGNFRGSVKGREFQKSFLSLWFGSKPVMESLKKELLGK